MNIPVSRQAECSYPIFLYKWKWSWINIGKVNSGKGPTSITNGEYDPGRFHSALATQARSGRREQYIKEHTRTYTHRGTHVHTIRNTHVHTLT